MRVDKTLLRIKEMKKIKLIILSFVWICNLNAQVGSDIRYIKESEIDSTLIGEYAHIDFYHRSFHSNPLDSIKLLINTDSIEFVEKRVDDGFLSVVVIKYLDKRKYIYQLDLDFQSY